MNIRDLRRHQLFTERARVRGAFLQSARARTAVKLYFNQGKGLPDPDRLLHGFRPTRAGFSWRARPHSLVRRSCA